MKRACLVLLASLLLVAGARAADKPAGPPTGPADLVLTNGTIYTVDTRLGRVEALAVRDGRVIAAGSAKEIAHWVGPNTRVIDLDGGFAMPGFNDAHTHMVAGGQQLLNVNEVGTHSLAEFQERIRDRSAEFPPGDWIVGSGWDENLWKEKRLPSRTDLDAIAPDHPMLIERVDGHSSVANSLALEKAGITRDTPDPPGGAIVHDEKGEPTGLLKEKAVALVETVIPSPSVERRKRGLLLAMAEAARLGITSVQDDSVRSDSAPEGTDWASFVAWRQLKDEGKMTLRVTEWLPLDAPLDRLKQMREEGGTTDPWLKTGALKAIVDGSGGSLTAAMLEPFANAPGNRGILRYDPERLKQMVVERDAAGFQINLHAIGDRANRVALDAFQAAQEANHRADARDRIEHAQFVAPADFERFHQLGVIASMQPSHLLNDLRWAPTILGPARYNEAYAWNSMLRHHVVLAFGTDFPVEQLNPMRGLYACLTREFEEGGPEGGWMPQEKIGIADAIRAYTWGSAYAEFEENRKGTLAPGMFADLIVLSRDITRAAPQDVLHTEVLMTFVGGRLVYEKK